MTREERLLAIKHRLRRQAEKAIPGEGEEVEKRRAAYVFDTLRKIKEKM